MTINTYKADTKDTAFLLAFISIMESEAKMNKSLLELCELYKSVKIDLESRGIINDNEQTSQ